MQRQSNFELLRILCMLFIIGGHILISQESMVQVGTMDFYIGNIYRSFAICAVNVFVLISGFWGIHLKIPKLLKLEFQVLFYCIIILLLSMALGMHYFSFRKDILLFFPVLTQRYWYITIYVILVIISPVLNFIVSRISEHQFKIMLIIIIAIFYCWPTICYTINAPSVTKDSGYGIINFVNLYFIGRYISLYGRAKARTKFMPLLFAFSGLVLFGANMLVSKIFGFYFQQYISYDSIFTLFESICLFLTFRNISFTSRIVNFFSSNCLSAYIIHAQPIVWSIVWEKETGLLNHNLSGIEYIMYLIFLPIGVYILCVFIDKIRVLCFNRLESKVILCFNKKKIIQYINCFDQKMKG